MSAVGELQNLEWYSGVPRSIRTPVWIGALLVALAFGGFGTWSATAPLSAAAASASFSRAARLVKVDFVAPPEPVGRNTVHALQSGFVFGFAGQIDGIVGRIRSQIGESARVVATGGLAGLIAPHSETIELVDPDLTLDGLRLVWERNQDA